MSSRRRPYVVSDCGRSGIGGGLFAARAALALAVLVVVLSASPASAAVGDLTQLPGTLGCYIQAVGETQLSPRCQPTLVPGGPRGVEISPDGRNAYVLGGGGLAIYDRDAAGVLTEKFGPDGCVSPDGLNPRGNPATPAGHCATGRNLGGQSAVISLDGRNLYVAGNGLAIFDRDPATGTLTQKVGAAGCISEDGSPAGTPPVNTCGDGESIGGSLAQSPDGKSIYVAGGPRGALTVFDRDTATGALTQLDGTAGCVGDVGAAGICASAKALERANSRAFSVAVSPDGTSVYVVSEGGGGAVVVFDRDPTTGEVHEKEGLAACIAQDGRPKGDPAANTCVDGRGLSGAQSVAISPDGKSVYVAAAGSHAVAIFDRDAATGELTQKPGKAGCISQDGSPAGTPVTSFCLNAGGPLDGAQFVRVSPDGETVYVSYGNQDPGSSVAWLDRNRVTGALTAGGCISDGGSAGMCTVGAWAGDFTGHLGLSPDGKSVYATGFDTGDGGFVVALDRELDLVAPDTTITSGPAEGSHTTDRSVTFEFSSSEASSTFGCSMDGEPLAPCSSPFVARGLAVGDHTFVVQATDRAGNIDTSPATRGFAVTEAASPGQAPAVPSPGPSTPPRDTSAPNVSSFGLVSNRFVVAAGSGPAGDGRGLKSRRGTTFRYTLSEAAEVRIVIVREVSGPRARGVRQGVLTASAGRGPNRLAFSGRIGSKALSVGRYRATLIATDAAKNASKPRTVDFRIVGK